jgi:hypothetical protein
MQNYGASDNIYSPSIGQCLIAKSLIIQRCASKSPLQRIITFAWIEDKEADLARPKGLIDRREQLVRVFENIMEVKWTFGFMKIKMILHFHKSVWHLHSWSRSTTWFSQPAQAIFDDPGVDSAASSKYLSTIGTS